MKVSELFEAAEYTLADLAADIEKAGGHSMTGYSAGTITPKKAVLYGTNHDAVECVLTLTLAANGSVDVKERYSRQKQNFPLEKSSAETIGNFGADVMSEAGNDE